MEFPREARSQKASGLVNGFEEREAGAELDPLSGGGPGFVEAFGRQSRKFAGPNFMKTVTVINGSSYTVAGFFWLTVSAFLGRVCFFAMLSEKFRQNAHV